MKILTGKVVSTKMNRTIIVEVERIFKHKLYGKRVRRHTRIKADTQDPSVKEGDIVTIVEHAPMSKDKHFVLKAITRKRKEIVENK